MGRSCCVPGCKSNYGNASHTSIFKFPKEKTLRDKWLNNICRDNFEINDKSVICIHHFESKFVVTEDIFPVFNGEPIRVSRKIPKLAEDAYPTIFPNRPSYHTLNLCHQRKDPEEPVLEILDGDELNWNSWYEEDTIATFESFAVDVRKRTVYPFLHVLKQDYALFIKIKDDDYIDIPSISVSFKVSSDLDVSVFYNNVCLPAEKFSWILGCKGSKDLKCDRWSKLENLVSHLANFSYVNVSPTERVDLVKRE